MTFTTNQPKITIVERRNFIKSVSIVPAIPLIYSKEVNAFLPFLLGFGARLFFRKLVREGFKRIGKSVVRSTRRKPSRNTATAGGIAVSKRSEADIYEIASLGADVASLLADQAIKENDHAPGSLVISNANNNHEKKTGEINIELFDFCQQSTSDAETIQSVTIPPNSAMVIDLDIQSGNAGIKNLQGEYGYKKREIIEKSGNAIISSNSKSFEDVLNDYANHYDKFCKK